MFADRIAIEPAVLRDVSYITANMRPMDRAEAYCQLPEDTTNYELAYMLTMGGDAFTARFDGKPVAAFGTAPINVACVSVWMVGTKDAWRVTPSITAYMRDVHTPTLEANGFLTMEARALLEHEQAHRWMEASGAVRSGEPFVFGRNGERFVLFRWTVPRYRARR